MPLGNRTFAADFDFIDHQLYVRDSRGASAAIPLVPQSVADFYAAWQETLRSLAIDVRIMPVPVEVQTAIPFAAGSRGDARSPCAASDRRVFPAYWPDPELDPGWDRDRASRNLAGWTGRG